jgi:soluble lytic murein transglycosylase-like protein
MRRKRPLIVTGIAVLVAVGISLYFVPQRKAHHETAVRPKPEAPPDLEKLRGEFAAGLDALHRKDGADALRHLASFDFGKRAVEEYRLYYLASAHQLAGDTSSARATLAHLWQRTPRMAAWPDAAMNLAGLYAEASDFLHAAAVYDAIGAHAETSDAAAPARWGEVETRFYIGDIGGLYEEARNLTVKNPRSPQAAVAMTVMNALTGADYAITPAERLERAVSFLRDGDPQNALDELTLHLTQPPPELRQPADLNRGLALYGTRHFEDAAKLFDSLAKAPPRIAVPALYFASRSYRILSASINPTVYKTIVVRQKIAPAKGKRKARYRKVKKQVPLIDLAKKAKKEEYDRLATQRLKDLLPMPLAREVRIAVLDMLIDAAEAKNQDAYERELVPQIIQIDPGNEGGLQHFWDRGWGAYERGDFNGAREMFDFIEKTYRNVNVKRAARYWFARAGDRLGRKEEAAAIYRALAAAPYDDIYALESEARGAPRPPDAPNPVRMNRPDWRDVAEKNMPPELRLAYELTALSDVADARREIAKNQKFSNQRFADALTADLDNSTGNMEGMMLAARRAFPELATVDQDSVPPYFLKMYYPVRYEDAIRKYASKEDLDPYLVFGLIHQESYFDPRARSPVGAVGLMQLMPPTARELAQMLHTSSSLTDPVNNIRLGTHHLRQLVDLFHGNTNLAIASYNAGQGRVMQWRRAAPGKPMDEFIEAISFRETRTYVKHVVMLQSTYHRMLE